MYILGALLLMCHILHDLMHQNPRNCGNNYLSVYEAMQD